MPGTGALLLLAFASLVIVLLLVLLHLTRLGFLIRATIPDRPRQRMFIASVSFLVTFVGVRILVSLITHHVGPFHWVTVRGHHIHHLVWGILILLLVGYGWLLDLGRSHSPLSIFFSRLMSVSYGVGAALTLDEFALWLNLEDDYWTSQGRESIDAVIIFGSLLFLALMNQDLVREATQIASGRRDAGDLLRHDAARRDMTSPGAGAK